MTTPAAHRPAVFLDRDGVLNRAVVRDGKPYPPQDLTQLEVMPGVPDALRRLKAAGFVLVVVTNQPDVARGRQERSVIEALNERLRALLPCIDHVEVCYEDGFHRRRKPQPGMLLDAAAALNLDLAGSFMVGDRKGDVEAGRQAGCRTVFLDRGYAEAVPEAPDHRAADLATAVDWIVQQRAMAGGQR